MGGNRCETEKTATILASFFIDRPSAVMSSAQPNTLVNKEEHKVKTVISSLDYIISNLRKWDTTELPALSRPYVKIKLNSKPVRALYDTGASLSILSSNLTNQLNVNQTTISNNKNTLPKLTSVAKGATVNITHHVDIEVTLSESTEPTTHRFFVSNNLSEDAIIGIDLIGKLKLSYDATNGNLFTTTHKFEQEWKMAKAVALQPVRLEPRQAKAIQISIDTEREPRAYQTSDITIFSQCRRRE